MSKTTVSVYESMLGDVNRVRHQHDAARQAIASYQELVKAIAERGWEQVASSEEWRHLGYAMDDLRVELTR